MKFRKRPITIEADTKGRMEKRGCMKLPTYTCLRCHHIWVPRKATRPVVCASCNSPYWDIPRPVKAS